MARSARRNTLVASAALSLLVGGLGASAAHAGTGTDLYVDDTAATCSDSGPGSAAQPFCQLQPAADAATAGTTVHVARGVDYAPVTIRSVGTADAPVTFAGGANSADGPSVRAADGTTSAVSFAGARYVTMSGFTARAVGVPTLVVTGSEHIDVDSSNLMSSVTTDSTRPTVTVDGASSALSFTRLGVPQVSGRAFDIAPGAQDVTLADDSISTTDAGSGVFAAGTDGLVMAGDTIATHCRSAISLTGGTSGSVENTVVAEIALNLACASTGAGKIVVDADSAPKVTADYNAVNPSPGGSDYSWSGTAYSTAAALQAATGQGAHDLDQTDVTLPTLATALTEHSPLIDSGDATAPGELATDRSGRPRVDDPLVADTGNGGGHYDRGSVEFQDPLRISGLNLPRSPYAGQPYTYAAVLSDPWSTAEGAAYAFDFGDGQTLRSGTPSVGHTYADQGSYDVSVTMTKADGSIFPSTDIGHVQVQPIAPLTESIGCSAHPSAPDTTTCDFSTGTSFYAPTSGKISYGDGSAAVLDAGGSETLTHHYSAPGAYTVTRTVTDAGGRTASATATAVVGPSYVQVWPTRVLDTRNGTGAKKAKIGPGGVVRVKVVGAADMPAGGVRAVTMNVTDVNATSSGVVTAYADGTSRPVASNLNFLAGQISPNLVTVPVSKDGYVDLYNSFGSVDLVADVQGYYYDALPDSWVNVMSNTAPVDPVRVLDTRNGTGARKGIVGPGGSLTITLPGAGGLATQSALLHVTATGGTGNGVVTVACGSAYPPTASNLNYRAGQTVSNLVSTGVCTGGKVTVYNSGSSVHLVADLQALATDDYAGYSPVDDTSPVGLPFVPTAPTRFLDTRSGLGSRGAVGANGTVALKVAGVGSVPSSARAVLVNLTGTGPTASTYITAYGAGPLPVASTLNLAAGETRPALTLIPVDADGYIHLHNFAGSVHLVADLEGYFG